MKKWMKKWVWLLLFMSGTRVQAGELSPVGFLKDTFGNQADYIYRFASKSDDHELEAMVASPSSEGYHCRDWDQSKVIPEVIKMDRFNDACAMEIYRQDLASELEKHRNGHYDFVYLEDQNGDYQFRFIQHGDPQSQGHGSVFDFREQQDIESGEVLVIFAGQMVLKDGKVERWDNLSGHFRPSDRDHGKVPLPASQYTAGYIQAYEKARWDAVAEILDGGLLDQVPLLEDDVKDLVGGKKNIDEYQIIDNRSLKDHRSASGSKVLLDKYIRSLKSTDDTDSSRCDFLSWLQDELNKNLN